MCVGQIQRLLYLFPVEQSQAKEAFIARQIAGLRELGLPEESLAREEKALRSGFATSDAFAALLDALHGSK
jgi:hypothetical protein